MVPRNVGGSNHPLRQCLIPQEREPQLHLYENLRLAHYVSLSSSLSRTLWSDNDKDFYFEGIRKLFIYLSCLHFNIYLCKEQSQQFYLCALKRTRPTFRDKGKDKVIPLQARCGPEGGQRYSSTLPWPWHQKGVSGQQHVPAALYPRERPGTHSIGGWVGLRDLLR